jgi:hypothetical protein
MSESGWDSEYEEDDDEAKEAEQLWLRGHSERSVKAENDAKVVNLAKARLGCGFLCHMTMASNVHQLHLDLIGKHEATPKQINEWILESKEFGLLSIAFTHPCNYCCIDAIFKIFPIILIVVQVVLPLGIWWGQYQENQSSCYLTEGPTGEETGKDRKLLMCVLGFYYLVKMTMLSLPKTLLNSGGLWGLLNLKAVFGSQSKSAQDENDMMNMLAPLASPLCRSVLFDEFMQGPFEYMLYVLNLYVVWHQDNGLEMVLNAVAFEFVMEIDEKYKEMYMKYNGSCVDSIIDGEWREAYESVSGLRINLLCNWLVTVSEVITSVFTFIVILAFTSVGSICKF